MPDAVRWFVAGLVVGIPMVAWFEMFPSAVAVGCVLGFAFDELMERW